MSYLNNSAYLEHTNITVKDPDFTANQLMELFGWKVRWSGKSMGNGYTVHVGNERSYLALYTNPEVTPATRAEHSVVSNLNHVAVVVNNLQEVKNRAVNLGLEPFNFADYHPGNRFYLMTDDRLEIEIVSYAPASRALPQHVSAFK